MSGPQPHPLLVAKPLTPLPLLVAGPLKKYLFCGFPKNTFTRSVANRRSHQNHKVMRIFDEEKYTNIGLKIVEEYKLTFLQFNS